MWVNHKTKGIRNVSQNVGKAMVESGDAVECGSSEVPAPEEVSTMTDGTSVGLVADTAVASIKALGIGSNDPAPELTLRTSMDDSADPAEDAAGTEGVVGNGE